MVDFKGKPFFLTDEDIRWVEETLAGMSTDHPYIAQYNSGRGIIVVGQGPWELPDTTFRVRDLCAEKGIDVWVDVWGHDEVSPRVI